MHKSDSIPSQIESESASLRTAPAKILARRCWPPRYFYTQTAWSCRAALMSGLRNRSATEMPRISLGPTAGHSSEERRTNAWHLDFVEFAPIFRRYAPRHLSRE